jgi:hypothetical protein
MLRVFLWVKFMKYKPYYEKLKDPRWQKKRLEVMQEHNFECEDCGTNNETLHVHHAVYLKGKEPWEYENYLLKCLCEKCHESNHKIINNFDKVVEEIKIICSSGNGSLSYYAGVLAGLSHDGPFGIYCLDFEFCDGLGEVIRRSPEFILDNLKDNYFDGQLYCDLRLKILREEFCEECAMRSIEESRNV